MSVEAIVREGAVCRKCSLARLLIGLDSSGAILVRCPGCERSYRIKLEPLCGQAKCRVTVHTEAQ